MANNIVEFNINGTSYTQRPYGTCSTAAGTAAKVVTCSGFNLVTGTTVMVKFTNANTVANPTLNVNSKGAKAIYYRGAALTASSLANWGAGDVVEFRYNGTQWDLLNVGNTAGEGEANVQSDWNVTDATSDAYIKNKPTIPAAVTSSTVSGWGFTKNAGTVTKVSTGVGLTGGDITSLGTIKCKLNSETSLGTIGTTSKLYAVGVDANGKLCVNVPWVSGSDDTNTTYTFAGGTNGFTVTPSGGSAQTVTVTPSISNNVTYSGTLTTNRVAVFDGTEGQIKASGYTIAKSVPSSAVFTDTKVTSAANHYDPAEDTSAAITATGGTATNITGTSGKLNVVTGLKRDAKGHVVGVTCANIYSTDNASGGSDGNYYHTPTYSSGLSIATGTGVDALYVPIAGATSAGVVCGFHRTSGTATGTKTTNASNNPAVNSRTTTSGRYYGVETDKNGYMFVNVPWSSEGEANVQSDWNVTDTTSDAYIKNKPTIPTIPASIVTSITVGTGLTTGTLYDDITSSGTISLKVASSTEIGGIQLGYTASGKNYPVKLDNNKAYVNVPWTGEANVQSDWNVTDTTSDAYIKNKPTIPAAVTVDSTLSSTSTNPVQNKIIHAALNDKVNSDDLATVATSGSYNDLTDKPTITDTKVTQTVTTSNANYPILLAPSTQTTTTTGTAYFETDIKINPSTRKITGVDYISSDSTDLHIQCDEWLILDGGGDGCGIRPNSSSINDCDLGTTSIRFRNGYFSNQVFAANGFYESSDERLKDFGEGLRVDLDALSKLRKSYFTFKDKPEDPQIGVSAQEIQKLYPEVVIETSDGHLNVDYAKLSVVALAAIDQLNDKVKSLEDRLARLEKLLENK